MEAKKNPDKDIHKMSGMFFQIGLGISTAIVITAFEWTTEFKKPYLRTFEDHNLEIISVPVTEIVEPLPPSPIKKETVPVILKSFNPILDDNSLSKNESPEVYPVDVDDIRDITPFVIERDIKENIEEIFTFPENPAQPIGGYEAFYDLLRKNLKYPVKARRFQIEGKVFIEFVINKEGIPSQFTIIRGLGYGCDEEAVRVIGLSKWNPGQQRGNPVRVRMVLPVIFKLQ